MPNPYFIHLLTEIFANIAQILYFRDEITNIKFFYNDSQFIER